MTQAELRYLTAVPNYLKEIAEQLKKLNQNLENYDERTKH